MIRTLLATTAIATLVASGAMAQTTSPTTAPSTTAPGAQMAPEQPMVKHAEGHLASDIIGKSVYNGTGDDAQSIGKVSDLVLDDKGDVKAIVVGVGGFLGIGQKNVALEYDLVQWAEKDDQEWLVVETTADALKALPEFDANAYEPMPADADVTETKPATKEDLDNAPKPEENADQSGATTDEGAAGSDTGVTAPDDQSDATTDEGATDTDTGVTAPEDQSGAATDEGATDTDTGATSDDQPADSATGTETNEPAMDSDTGGSDTMKKDDAAQ